jgi:predicted transposase YbfD/YdcC
MDKINIVKHFTEIKDYRMIGKIDYPLVEMLSISVCAILCGAEGYADIARFGNMKIDILKRFLKLENGIPSQDTFERLFRYIKPKQFARCFLNLVKDISKIKKGIIPIDGKALKGANDAGENPIYVVSAWARESGIVIANKKVDKKSNEITAIPEILEMIDIKGCIITIDAMGCQKKIVKQIAEKKADYVISLKGNQGATKEEVEDFYKGCLELGFGDIKYDYCETLEKSHGRIERRKYYITEYLDYIHLRDKWANLKSIGMVHSIVERNGKKAEDKRYHIASIPADAKQYAECVRGHWSIENNCNWVMDVVFKEDKSRIRKDYSAENMAVVRRIAMNIVKTNSKLTGSIRGRLKQMSWDTELAVSILFENDSETM